MATYTEDQQAIWCMSEFVFTRPCGFDESGSSRSNVWQAGGKEKARA